MAEEQFLAMLRFAQERRNKLAELPGARVIDPPGSASSAALMQPANGSIG